MFKIIKNILLCLSMLVPFVGQSASATELASSNALTAEKSFKQDGLRFQISVSKVDETESSAPLIKIDTKVTNISTKSIPYIQTVCEDVRSSIEAHSPDEELTLLPASDETCTPTTHDKILPRGKSIQQSELFTTADLPEDFDLTKYELYSSLLLGSQEKKEDIPQKLLKLEISFDADMRLTSDQLTAQAELRNTVPNKYQLEVQGTVHNKEIKSVTFTFNKAKSTLKINKTTRAISLTKKLTIKQTPPEWGVMNIVYMDGTKVSMNIPVK